MSTVHLPPLGHPVSTLDGFSLMGIDTDPNENLAQLLISAKDRGLKVVTVIPWVWHGVRPGFIVVLYDESKVSKAG